MIYVYVKRSALIFVLCLVTIVDSVFAQNENVLSSRFVWQVHRLYRAGSITPGASVTREPIMLKFDTATGRIWRYSGDFEDVGGSLLKIGQERFSIIPVEKLGPKIKKENLRANRFKLIRISVPAVIKREKKVSTIDKPELMILDTETGRNWMLRRVYEEKDGLTTKVYRFVLLTNDGEGEYVVLASDEEAESADGNPEKVENAEEEPWEPEEEPVAEKVVLPADAFALVSPFQRYQKTDSWWRNVYMDNYKGNTFRARNRNEVDCIVFITKESEHDKVPWVLVRKRASLVRPLPQAGPRQKKLISDAAVDYICRAVHVSINDTERLAVFISGDGVVKGFVNVDKATVDAIPEINKISRILFVD